MGVGPNDASWDQEHVWDFSLNPKTHFTPIKIRIADAHFLSRSHSPYGNPNLISLYLFSSIHSMAQPLPRACCDLQYRDPRYRNLYQFSFPTMRYAMLRNHRNSSKQFCVFGSFERLREAITMQVRLENLLEPTLADQIALKYYPELYHDPGFGVGEGFELVTDRFDFTLYEWYRKKLDEFAMSKRKKDQWLSFIWEELKALMRVGARYFGKVGPPFSHGNLLGGFVFAYNRSGEFEDVFLHNLRSDGSFLADVESFWKIIVVIACRLDSAHLSSQTNLMRVGSRIPKFRHLAFPALRAYVNRIKAVCHSIRTDCNWRAKNVLNFIFEDPLIWSTRECVDFLKKFTYQLFNVLPFGDLNSYLEYMEEIEESVLENLKFQDLAMQQVYNNKKDLYKTHGWIVKLVRNLVHHYNIVNREKIGDHKGLKEIEIHELAEEAFRNAFGGGDYSLVGYAFQGLLKYLQDVTKKRSDKNDLITGMEFREGFPGHDYFGR